MGNVTVTYENTLNQSAVGGGETLKMHGAPHPWMLAPLWGNRSPPPTNVAYKYVGGGGREKIRDGNDSWDGRVGQTEKQKDAVMNIQ